MHDILTIIIFIIVVILYSNHYSILEINSERKAGASSLYADILKLDILQNEWYTLVKFIVFVAV